jgi:hypothetical protein
MFVLKLQTFFDETCYLASGNERVDESADANERTVTRGEDRPNWAS